MNRSNMIQQANLSRKTIVTKFTFERLFLLMNHTNMYIQVTFFRTLFVTKFTFKMLLFFMNRSNMVQQATFSRKIMITKFTFARLFLLMNRSNMSIQVIWGNMRNFGVNTKNRTSIPGWTLGWSCHMIQNHQMDINSFLTYFD